MYGEWGHFLKARMNWVVGLKKAFSTRCDQPLNYSFPPPLMSTSFPLFCFVFFLHKALTLLYCYQHIKPIVKETHVLTLLGFVSFTIMSCVPAASPSIEQNRTVFSRRPTHPKHLRSRVTEGKYLRKSYSSIKMRCQWRTGTSAHFLRR